jgi:hypothetical protein
VGSRARNGSGGSGCRSGAAYQLIECMDPERVSSVAWKSIHGANGGGRTHMAVNRWNLNPVRLPVPPRSHGVDCRYYIGLAGEGSGTAGLFDGQDRGKSRGFAAAAAGGRLNLEAIARQSRALDVQPVVRLALGR